MARTRVTLRRVDPWSILKFGFVATLVLLGIQLLAGAVLWYVIQRLELIQTVCELAATVGFEECGVDGGALFDTVLVLGLLGVVIQTGILVFLTFLANLIFDLTGGLTVTLEDVPTARSGPRTSRGAGTSTTRTTSAASLRGAGAGRGGSSSPPREERRSPSTAGTTGSSSSSGHNAPSSDDRARGVNASDGSATSGGPWGPGAGASGDDDTLFRS